MSPLQPWTVLTSELAFDHPWAKVRRDVCQIDDGTLIDGYYYWEGGDFVQICAITTDRQIVVVRQYKHGVRELVRELPAGMVDARDLSPLATAQRELREETGFESSMWIALGTLNVSSAKSTTRAHVFLALDARCAEQQELDLTERIEVELYTQPQIMELITRGEIHDSNSLATYLLALPHLR